MRTGLLFLVLSMAACGGGSHSRARDAGRDTGPMDDDAGMPDAGPTDPDAGPGAPVGAPCAFAGDCQGEFCITEGIAPGFVDGYCTGSCDLDADPVEACVMHGGDGFCIEVMKGQGACFDQCDPDAMPSDCREPDYLCLPIGGGRGLCIARGICGDGEVGFGEECDPPDMMTCDAMCQGTGTAPVGSACASAADCAGDACIMEFPGGYCTDVNCDLDAPTTSCASAGGDALCLPTGEPGMEVGICADRCDPAMMSADCRPEYECVELDAESSICLPRPVCGNGEVERGEECDPPDPMVCSETCQGFGTAPVGAACESATDCAGNACITAMDGWPNGYCSQAPCDLDPLMTMACASAGGDGVCVDVAMMGEPPFGICADRCGPLAPTPDCRPGYTCMLFGTEMVCAPTGAGMGM